jgi:hypothetical protein
MIGNGIKGSGNGVPSIEKGEVYNLDNFRPSFSLPTIGDVRHITLETHADFDVRIYSLMRTFFILSASGDLSSSVELYFSNSIGSGGFTITPETGTQIFGNNLDGKKINQALNAILKVDPTIVNLPATPNFIVDLTALQKITSGNTTSTGSASNKVFFEDKYLIVPAGVNVVMKMVLKNNFGSAFNLESYTEMFLIESPKGA